MFDLFKVIDGHKGETLTSAILKFLITRSGDVREKIIGVLSDAVCDISTVGPLSQQSHFYCDLEIPTAVESAISLSGRVDLVIETDNAVIGLENKLQAAFGEDQPKKYLETIRKRAEALRTFRGKEHKESPAYMVIVLGPEDRRGEVGVLLRKQQIDDSCAFASWETVLSKIADHEFLRNVDVETQTVIRSLNEFVSSRIDPFAPFPKLYRHLNGRFGNPTQGQFLEMVEQFFPATQGARVGQSEGRWRGKWFSSTRKENEIGWYGFMSKGMLSARTNGPIRESEMIFASTHDIDLPDSNFMRVEVDRYFCFPNNRKAYAWLIKFDEKWKTPKQWREALAAIHSSFTMPNDKDGNIVPHVVDPLTANR